MKGHSNEQVKTSIWVKYRQHKLSALIDTGSDVSIAGEDIARNLGWTIHAHRTKEVSVANDDVMLISGVARVLLRVGRRKTETEILISPDFEGLILGYDWLYQQGRLVWDVPNARVRIGTGNWIKMHDNEPSVKIRRIFAVEDVTIPAHGQVAAAAHMLHNAWSCQIPQTQYGVMESQPVTTMEHVYSGRTLLPLKTTKLQVPILNTRSREVTLLRGTLLGKVFTAEANTSTTSSLNRVSRIRAEDAVSPAHEEVIKKMVDGLPPELTSEREKVRDLLTQHRTILSTGDHDVGRTPLVEHTIDTGDHRPIRQPLRRQPFQQQTYIDEETNRMLEYGIIEPAASPWASNVVLVKKKDGSLRFCVDYRRLNTITYKDSYPLPLIDNCLNALSGSSWYSTLDLRSGYYNIPIAESDRDKSAFITRRGCFRFSHAIRTHLRTFRFPAAHGRGIMRTVLSSMYLDDIIVFGKTFDEQLERLGEVFQSPESRQLEAQTVKVLPVSTTRRVSGTRRVGRRLSYATE